MVCLSYVVSEKLIPTVFDTASTPRSLVRVELFVLSWLVTMGVSGCGDNFAARLRLLVQKAISQSFEIYFCVSVNLVS